MIWTHNEQAFSVGFGQEHLRACLCDDSATCVLAEHREGNVPIHGLRPGRKMSGRGCQRINSGRAMYMLTR